VRVSKTRGVWLSVLSAAHRSQPCSRYRRRVQTRFPCAYARCRRCAARRLRSEDRGRSGPLWYLVWGGRMGATSH
jgi:hypothetical protein